MATAGLTDSDVRVRDTMTEHIAVTVSGSQAVLTGSVASWPQRDAAERAVADAPGITHIENRILVEPRSIEAVPDEIC